MINTLIVDDEPRAIKALQLLLEKHCPDVKVIGNCKNINDAFQQIRVLNPDLIFLDVSMPQGSGIELLKRIESSNVQVIMTTAHKDYAIDALRHSVLDYLLKPIDKADLRKAVDRFYKSQMHDKKSAEKPIVEDINHITVNTIDGISIINLSEVLYIQSDKNYSSFHLEEEVVTSSKSIGEYEKLLGDTHFFRIHRSYLVNLKMIKMIKKGKSPFLILKNDHQLEVAKNRKDALIEAIEGI